MSKQTNKLCLLVTIFFISLPNSFRAQVKLNKDTLFLKKHNYQQLRYEEDWSYLKDSSLQSKGLDKLKFVFLNKTKIKFVTFGGESRLRYEYYQNENFSNQPYKNNGYFQQRTMLHTDLHWSKHFRLFTQITSGTIHGRKGGARSPLDEDVLDMNQMFVDIGFQKNRNSFYLRAGRQELFYGTGKFVDPREGPNARLSFDAVRVIMTLDRNKIDAFISKSVDNIKGLFNNRANENSTFWGVYTSWQTSKNNGVGLDIYYLGINNKVARFQKGTGDETRHTNGFRLYGAFKKFEYDFENALQIGTFNNSNIFAWTTTLNVKYQLSSKLLYTKLGLGGAINSGDGGNTNSHLGTFNALFPTGFYFGAPAYPIGPANLMGFSPSISTVISKQLLFLSNINFFYRQNVNDAIYSPIGRPLRDGSLSRSAYVGNQLNITLKLKLNDHFQLMPSFALFTPGDFINQTGASKQISYFNTDFTFKF